MNSFVTDFHFLRPLWFLALLPIAVLTWWLAKRHDDNSGWQQAIDATLLPHLISVAVTQRRKRLWPLVCCAWVVGVVALAGPSWQKLPQPVMQQQDALVVVLDLTLSMYATDKSPSRVVHAQHKLTDLLQKRKEGLTALVAFSGDAHTVTPLTDDTATIASMVSALAPDLMPVFGSNTTSGVARAVELLQQAGIQKGRILLMTDEVLPQDAQQIEALLNGRDISLLILGIGTTEGAPISKPEGGFLKRDDGSMIIARLNADDLAALATRCNGRYIDSRIDDSDIDYLLGGWQLENNTRKTEHEFDLWADQGHYLVWLLLPAVLLAFRRGALAVIVLMLYLPSPSQALEWRDLWQRRDQQGAEALQQNRFDEAAEKFDDPAWRAAAQYRAGKFDAAAESLKALDNATANYNRGNALAQAGKLEDALAAYDRALQQDPGNEDAKINRQLTSDALEQQKKQQQNKDGQHNGQQDNDDKKDQQQGSQQQNDQQKGDQQNGQPQSGQDDAESQQDGEQSAQQQDSGQQDGSQQSRDQQQADNDAKNDKDAGQKDAQSQDAESQSASPQTEAQARAHNEKQQQAAQKDQQGGDDKQNEQQLQQAIAQQQQQRDAEKQNPSTPPTQASIADMPVPQTEQQQALEQWLRRVPDDPGGLMRNKFNYQYRVNQREGKHIQEQEQVW